MRDMDDPMARTGSPPHQDALFLLTLETKHLLEA